MTVTSLRLCRFRNYSEQTLLPAPGVNVICGENAQGKTNLLESLYFSSVLRPFGGAKERDLIAEGENEAQTELTVDTAGREVKLTARLSRTERRAIFIDGIRAKSGSEFAGTLKTVLFTPESLGIVRDSPAQRRKLLDTALCQLRPRYFSLLSEYNRCIEQKSALLKRLDEKPALAAVIPQYDGRLAELAGGIIAFRHAYVKQLKAFAAAICAAISGGSDSLETQYSSLSNIPDTGLPESALERLCLEHLEAHRTAELASRSCLSGPHRDDILFRINGLPAKTHASQGQTRTAALAVKLAERDIFFRDSGEYPVLLLDDVLSELDARRRSFVLNRITGGQVFITGCDVTEEVSGTRFVISGGRVV